MAQQPAILVVLPDESFSELIAELKASDTTVLHVFSCEEARQILAANCRFA